MKTEDDPNPYRIPPTTGPTPPAEMASVRARSAWRGFWVHRGEEISALAEWIDDRAGVCILLILTATVGAFVGIVTLIEASDDRACSATCDEMGAAGAADLGDCHCIDDNGKPWLWSEWPGK